MNQIMEHVDDSGMLKLINRCKMRHEELQADANDPSAESRGDTAGAVCGRERVLLAVRRSKDGHER